MRPKTWKLVSYFKKSMIISLEGRTALFQSVDHAFFWLCTFKFSDFTRLTKVKARVKARYPATEGLFCCCSDDKAELFHLTLVFLAALHNINSCGVDTGMTEKVSQFCYIFLRPVERHGEQAAKIVREHFPAVYARLRAQPLKLLPDVGAVQRLSVCKRRL